MRFFNSLYDLHYLGKCLLGLLGVIAVMYVLGGAGFGVAFIILFTCLSRNNTELLFYTLLMTISITMGNANIVNKGTVFAIEQRVLLLLLAGVMVVRIAGSQKSPLLRPFLWLLPYVLFMIWPSVTGWNPVISLMKIFLFAMIYVAYFGVANAVINSSRDNAMKIRSVFLMLAVFFIFGSVALIPFPGLATLSWEIVEQMIARGETVTSLFTGMTIHSQALGPVCSALGVMLYADLVFSIKKPDRLYLALLVCVPVLIWKTGSRTALGSFMAGMAFVTFFFMRARNVRNTWRSKVVSAFLMIVVGVSMVVVVLPSAREKVANFALKFNTVEQQEVTLENMVSTRRGKWDSALYNFKQSPMIGNGFQVSEDLIGIAAGFNTLSAPVEKGVWITAILEEGGVCGFVLFIIFVLTMFSSLSRHRCYQGMAGFFMLLLINFGEFTMFSMSSVGGVIWSLVFIGVVLDALRFREEKRLMLMPQYHGA